jgi:hypothetical protein
MKEKVEWEIVDERAPRWDSGAWQSAASGAAPTNLLQAMLGRWWRWKLAGFALVAVVALVLLAVFAGVFVLVALGGVILSLAVAKARRLFGRHGNSLTPRP